MWFPGIKLLIIATFVAACAWRVEATGTRNVTFFTRRLLERYGSSDLLNVSQADALLHWTRQLAATAAGRKLEGDAEGAAIGMVPSAPPCATNDTDCIQQTQCINTAALFELYEVPLGGANISQVAMLMSGLLYQLQNENCYKNGHNYSNKSEGVSSKSRPSVTEIWGFSFLSVTIINICPLLGIFFYPLMKTRIYRKVLMCTVGFAVGTLSATAIIVLIPEGFELLNEDSPVKDIFRWRALVVIVGIYVFFNIERILGFIFQRRERELSRKEKMAGQPNNGYNGDLPVPMDPEIEKNHGHSHNMVPPANIVKKWAPAHKVKPVAWMIIIGDAMHNFMDGLSIGSAFTRSPLAGLGISLAIFSEELPHELGDFAVLLNAGMSLRQAAAMNFVSAISCYLGMVAGIVIGNIPGGAYWVFALTGGMFLYISLVEMLPEMNEQAMEEEDLTGHVAIVYLLQNIGLIFGWMIIFIVSYYAGSFPS